MDAFIFAFGALSFVVLFLGCLLWVGSLLYKKFYKDPRPKFEETEKLMLRIIEADRKLKESEVVRK